MADNIKRGDFVVTNSGEHGIALSGPVTNGDHERIYDIYTPTFGRCAYPIVSVRRATENDLNT